jgi:chromosome segregation ATPase
MDSNSIATLQDYKATIERIFKRIDKQISSFNSSESSQQNIILSQLKTSLDETKNNLSLMKMEIANLSEQKQQEWENELSKLQTKNNTLKQKVIELQNKKQNEVNVNDELDINKKIDVSKLTSQQAIDRGNKILDDDDRAIKNMKKIVGQDLTTMKDVNVELNRQQEALEIADKNLTEIDYSLKRAGQQIKTMFKMYATDKLIMCMIIVIVLVIITIIILSAVGKKKNGGKSNIPTDIFK